MMVVKENMKRLPDCLTAAVDDVISLKDGGDFDFPCQGCLVGVWSLCNHEGKESFSITIKVIITRQEEKDTTE